MKIPIWFLCAPCDLCVPLNTMHTDDTEKPDIHRLLILKKNTDWLSAFSAFLRTLPARPVRRARNKNKTRWWHRKMRIYGNYIGNKNRNADLADRCGCKRIFNKKNGLIFYEKANLISLWTLWPLCAIKDKARWWHRKTGYTQIINFLWKYRSDSSVHPVTSVCH